MLTEEDFRRFTEFKVSAMGERLREMVGDPAYDGLTFEEKVKEMIDAQVNAKETNKIARLVKAAGFKLPAACVEGIVYLPERKLSRDRVERLASCGWVEDNGVVALISRSGCGKSYVAQALGNAACRRLHGVRYRRLADLLADLSVARAEGVVAYRAALEALQSVKLLIVDDFLTTPIGTQGAVDLFEVLEGRGATLIASQLEPEQWYLRIEGELMADSILGRTASRAMFLDIDGPDMRKYLAGVKAGEAGTN